MSEIATDPYEDTLDGIILDYLILVEAGQEPDRQEFIARYPEFAGPLAAYFAEQDRVKGCMRPLVLALVGAKQGAEEKEQFPQILGDLEIEKEISQGGMGVVYQAWQASGRRHVAVKMIKPGELVREEDRERFLREARSTATLEHPGIVRIYTIGWHKGEPFYSMEYLRGGNLKTRIEDLNKNPRETARLMKTVAEAVHFANQRGKLHRDLKPANILFDGFGHPKVADFGLVKRLKAARLPSHEETQAHAGETSTSGAASFGTVPYLSPEVTRTEENLTGRKVALPVDARAHARNTATSESASSIGLTPLSEYGAIIGTLAYMSPEAARAEENLTVRADVWGLGAILYECLTGKAPNSGDSVLEMLKKLDSDEPIPRPSLNKRRVDADLAAICMKCLHKNPEKRYDSAAEVAKEFGDYLEDLPVRARLPSTRYRLKKWVQRHPLIKWVQRQPVIAVLVALVAILTAILAVVGVIHRYQTEKHLEQARQRLYAGAIVQALRDADAGLYDLAEETLRSESCPEEMRCWAWHYVLRRCREQRMTLRGHTGPVTAAAYSPDGRWLATASKDGTVRLWNPHTGELQRVLRGHSGAVLSVAFRSNAELLTAGETRLVRRWDLKKNKELGPLGDHQGELVAASPAAGLVAVLGLDRIVRIYDRDGKVKHEMHVAQSVTRLAISPDGHHLAAAGYNRLLSVWDTTTGKRVPLQLPEDARWNNIWAMAFHPLDGSLVAAGNEELCRWKLSGGKNPPIDRYTGSGYRNLYSLAFSPDGSLMAGSAQDRQVRIWDAATGKIIRILREHSDCFGVAFHPGRPGGVQQLAVLRGKEVNLERLTPKEKIRWSEPLATGLPHSLADLTSSPDGRWLACRAGARRVELFAAPGRPAWRRSVMLPFDLPADGRLAFRSDSEELLIGAGTLGLVRVALSGAAAGKPVVVDTAPAHLVVAAPEGDHVATAKGGTWCLRDDDGKPIPDTVTNAGVSEISCMAFSRDGKRLAVGGLSGVVKVFDTATRRVLAELRTSGRGVVTTLAFDPKDSDRLATFKDVRLVIWRIGRSIDKIFERNTTHVGQVARVIFSPDGKCLVSCSHDASIKVWAVGSGMELLSLEGHDDRPVTGVAFDPDGRSLISCGHDGALRIWDGSPVD